MSIVNKINHYNEQLAPYNTRLIAVSKTKPVADLLQAYEGGQRDFGENKVQELTSKFETMPKDIQWHMIGHLQRNKVKYIAPFVHLIHAVDSPRLLAEINKQALKNDRVISCLLQIHIAQEETKFGFDESEVLDFMKSEALSEYKNVKVLGLMGMATNTDNKEQVSKEFNQLKALFDQIKNNFDLENVDMQELSTGMTNDYIEACKAGSTMVRIGSAIFGARNYPEQ